MAQVRISSNFGYNLSDPRVGTDRHQGSNVVVGMYIFDSRNGHHEFCFEPQTSGFLSRRRYCENFQWLQIITWVGNSLVPCAGSVVLPFAVKVPWPRVGEATPHCPYHATMAGKSGSRRAGRVVQADDQGHVWSPVYLSRCDGHIPSSTTP